MSGHISESIYGLLMRQGLRAETAGTVEAQGIGDGGVAGKSAPRHQPAKREGGPLPMGMEPGKGRGPQPAPVQQGRSVSIKQARRHPFLVVIADNVDVVPTRQRRGDVRLSLVRT